VSRLGYFFAVNSVGRWLTKHGHRLLHRGKTGRYAFRVAEEDRACLICRAVWAFIEVSFPSLQKGSTREQH
jgi:hypothetical protein